MARVLITGATGFIGQHFAEALSKNGDDISCLVRATSQVEPLQKLGARLVPGDVTHPSGLPAAVENVDVVYHLAGRNKANTLTQYSQVNEAGVQNIVDACARRTTPPVVILLSSLSAAGPMQEDRLRTESDPPCPISHYGRSKRAGEIAAESFAGKVPITVLRPPVVFGPGDRAGLSLFRIIRKVGIHAMLGLGKRVSLVFVGDVVNAAINAAQNAQRLPAVRGDAGNSKLSSIELGRGYYFVAADEHPAYAELGYMVGRAVDRPDIKLLRIPHVLVYGLAGWNEIAGRIFRRPQYLNLDRLREMKGGHWICSPEKARRELGFATAATRLLQLANRLRFDLPDAFAGDRKRSCRLLPACRRSRRPGRSAAGGFRARGSSGRASRRRSGVFEQFLVDVVQRIVFAMVLQELAEEAVVVIAHRLVERQRLAGHLHDAAGVFQRQAGRRGRFFDARLAAVLLHQLAGHGPHLAHRVDHVHRHADRAALVGNRPGDRLANPPGGVGRELVAAGVLELVDRPHQAGVAFLNQVEEAQARGCDIAWRSRPPAAGCRPTARVWRRRSVPVSQRFANCGAARSMGFPK